MPYFMGLDGGGSHLRIVIVDETMNIHASAQFEGVNPGGVGRERAAQIIQDAIRAVLTQFNTGDVQAVGVGIAGASTSLSLDWLVETVHSVLPGRPVTSSSDLEIALIGAHGKPEGVLLLAGTGSAALCITEQGETLQFGGWGYLLGDAGGGYWIGMEALHLIVRHEDGLYQGETVLPGKVLQELGLSKPRDLIRWLYPLDRVPVKEIARLAQIVLSVAEADDQAAQQICNRAVEELTMLGRVALSKYHSQDARLAFAGSILENRNYVSVRVVQNLNLPDFPQSKYPPVVGAALMAKLHWMRNIN